MIAPDEHGTHVTPEPPDTSERSETLHGVDSTAGELGETADTYTQEREDAK